MKSQISVSVQHGEPQGMVVQKKNKQTNNAQFGGREGGAGFCKEAD